MKEVDAVLRVALHLNATIRTRIARFKEMMSWLQPSCINWTLACQDDSVPRPSTSTCLWKDGAFLLGPSATRRLSAMIGNVTCAELQQQYRSFRRFVADLSRLVPSGSIEESRQCRWNALYKRSPYAAAQLQSRLPLLAGLPYTAMHIRTVTPNDLKKYCSQGTDCSHIEDLQRTPEELCRTYLQAAYRVQPADLNISAERMSSIYLATTSAEVKRSCQQQSTRTLVTAAALPVESTHTQTGGRLAADAAFLDLFAMMDAPVLVRGRSSFSSSVLRARGLSCQRSGDVSICKEGALRL
ncbi:unnamed protein product [Symbiodinium natans]|uniref:Uncharacterized protein n=1 Tax=Symbiodinium natans TaxID=878477 RepID=A0A812SKA3_9DINO|nr:unnamed protein product [Symbiodinium natans]